MTAAPRVVSTLKQVEAATQRGAKKVIIAFVANDKQATEIAPTLAEIAAYCTAQQPSFVLTTVNVETSKTLADGLASDAAEFPQFVFYLGANEEPVSYEGADVDSVKKMMRMIAGDDVSSFGGSSDDDDDDADDMLDMLLSRPEEDDDVGDFGSDMEMDFMGGGSDEEEFELPSDDMGGEEDEDEDEEDGSGSDNESSIDEEAAEAMMEDVQQVLGSSEFGYGLENCVVLCLGDCNNALDVPPVSDPIDVVRATIEQSLFPIGLVAEPDGNYDIKISDALESAKDEDDFEETAGAEAVMSTHERLADEVVKRCQRVASGKTSASDAPAAFANLLEFFDTVTGLAEWVVIDARRSRAIFAKLNRAAENMLATFSDDKQLGLIGPKSRQFVGKAFEKRTREAAELAGDAKKLTKWGIAEQVEEPLPSKRMRKEGPQ